jgi:TRAP-type C4-dicarboxylate transport system permease small subunit
MRKVCGKIDRALTAFETVFLAVALFAMAGVLFAQVVGGAMGASPAWAGELAMYLMAWTMCVGAGAAARSGRHIAITVVADKLKGRPGVVARTAVRLLCVTFCAGLCAVGADFALMSRELGQRSVALGAPMWIVYLALPVSAAMMAFRFAMPASAVGAPPRKGALEDAP